MEDVLLVTSQVPSGIEAGSRKWPPFGTHCLKGLIPLMYSFKRTAKSAAGGNKTVFR